MEKRGEFVGIPQILSPEFYVIFYYGGLSII